MATYLRLFLLMSVALGLAIVLWQAKKMAVPNETVRKERPEMIGVTPAKSAVQVGTPAKITEEAAKPSRTVGGEVLANIQESAPLERIEPVPQPTPPPAPKPVEVTKPKSFERWRLVYNAVATSAGVFQTNEVSVVLPGIDVLAANEKCTLENGASWPCGMVARTSLRGFINGKALTCKLPDVPEVKSIEADCLLRGRDLGEWLVANGWARAKADGPYAAQEASAKQTRRGMFGNPPNGLVTTTP
jgi:endonuclease YncB( thermonuclease family)